MKHLLLVFVGGGTGSVLRYSISKIFQESYFFPWATFSVNVIGSFFIGLIFSSFINAKDLSENWLLFLGVGICGGFTTFSTFSIENLQFLKSGNITLFFVYSIASVVLGLAASWLGFLVRVIF